jgi:hypothetical protein
MAVRQRVVRAIRESFGEELSGACRYAAAGGVRYVMLYILLLLLLLLLAAAQQFSTGLGLRASCQHAAEKALGGDRSRDYVPPPFAFPIHAYAPVPLCYVMVPLLVLHP